MRCISRQRRIWSILSGNALVTQTPSLQRKANTSRSIRSEKIERAKALGRKFIFRPSMKGVTGSSRWTGLPVRTNKTQSSRNLSREIKEVPSLLVFGFDDPGVRIEADLLGEPLFHRRLGNWLRR